jgi:ribonuclease HII
VIDTLSTPQYSKTHLISHLYTLKKAISITDEICEPESCTLFLKDGTSYEKKIVISKKADRFFPIVSAASCVAKYIRDERLREIEKKWDLPRNSLGQGYPNKLDSNVMDFLESYKKEIKNRYFPFIRYSWSWAPLQEIIRPTLRSLDIYLQE